jgi:hypothetical protein
MKKTLEIIVQCIIICTAIYSMGLVTRWWYLQHSISVDFLCYYRAGSGVYDSYWIYNNYLHWLFYPLTLFEPYKACMFWAGLNITCFMVLTHKMFEVKYGWILVLLVIPQFKSYLQVGNIAIILCLLSTYPIPSLLAVLVKPYHIVFALLNPITAGFKQRYSKDGS